MSLQLKQKYSVKTLFIYRKCKQTPSHPLSKVFSIIPLMLQKYEICLNFNYSKFIHILNYNNNEIILYYPHLSLIRRIKSSINIPFNCCSIDHKDFIFIIGGELFLDAEHNPKKSPVKKASESIMMCGVSGIALNGEKLNIPAMYSSRMLCSAVIVQNRLFVIGGISFENKVLSSNEALLLGQQSWQLISPLMYARYQSTCSKFRKDIYISGGKDCSHRIIDIIEQYKIQEDHWYVLDIHLHVPLTGMAF